VIFHPVSEADVLSDWAESDWQPLNQNNVTMSSGAKLPRSRPIGRTIGIISSAVLSSKFGRRYRTRQK
jgi:hypothetical protein